MKTSLWLLLLLLFVSCTQTVKKNEPLDMQAHSSEQDILEILDNSAKDGASGFVGLGHAYSYLIDSRVNLFKGSNGRWAIAVERLGYNPRAQSVLLDVYYYGNCLKSMKVQVDSFCGYNTYLPINRESFLNSITDEETLKPESDSWIVRDKNINIKYGKHEYIANGVEMDSIQDSIGIEAVARLVAHKYAHLFRATDEELYSAIPSDMQKLMVLDEWHHKDYYLFPMEDLVPDYKKYNQETWLKDRPSSYETWRLIAKVIVSGDTTLYKPTIKANTHWKNWPNSGSL